MKELSIEEKAKRYDDLLVKLQEAKVDNDVCDERYCCVIDNIVPELKESEDEKIRKSIINLVIKSAQNGGMALHKWESQQMLSWLEKKGEQNTIVVIPKFRVGDIIRPKGSTAEYTIESISGECYHGKGWGLHISCDNDYELVEQKPADWLQEVEDKLANATPKQLAEWKEKYFKEEPADWSEEDERMYKAISIALSLKDAKRYLGTWYKTPEEADYWLKSLKDRYTWKPSSEQMVALEYFIINHNEHTGYAKDLEELRQNLKKLKE